MTGPDLRPPAPSEENGYLSEHVQLLDKSLKHWSGCGLLAEQSDPVITARELYFASFAVLSHGLETDPVINYCNWTAQQLFEMDWHELVQLPSRLSAESVVQAERDALLKRVTENGFIDDYSGVRISKSGKRFLIDHATVWNLLDDKGNYSGQAAMFSLWQPL